MLRRLALVLLVAMGGTACGSSGDRDPRAITVYAAQSLTAAFTEIGAAFEDEHPDAEVTFNFAGSAALVGQIIQGAPADVVATADEVSIDELDAAGLLASAPTVFARNLLAIVVREGNPKRIDRLADLAASGIVVSLCSSNVPCGSYARQALMDAGVDVEPAAEETSVAGVVGRVRSGEADAGVVYVTDVRAAGEVEGVPIPDAHNVPAAYPHAVVKATTNAVGAAAFVAFVESGAGQAILRTHGFLPR